MQVGSLHAFLVNTHKLKWTTFIKSDFFIFFYQDGKAFFQFKINYSYTLSIIFIST